MPQPPVNWYVDGPAWTLQVLGILESERIYRKAEHKCLDELRDAGVIR